MTKQRSADRLFPILESKAEHLKKYRAKISMIRPYEIVDFWAKKPSTDNALEALIDELFTLKPSEYFKIEVSEV